MFWTVREQRGKLGVMQRGTEDAGKTQREREIERASLILMHKHTRASELFRLETTEYLH